MERDLETISCLRVQTESFRGKKNLKTSYCLTIEDSVNK